MQTAKRNYSEVVQSDKFRTLLSSKKRFLLPWTIFFLIFYFVLPLMTSYTTILNNNAIGSISWAWVFAFAQFIMTWVLCIVYSKRSARFDRMIEQINQERRGERR